MVRGNQLFIFVVGKYSVFKSRMCTLSLRCVLLRGTRKITGKRSPVSQAVVSTCDLHCLLFRLVGYIDASFDIEECCDWILWYSVSATTLPRSPIGNKMAFGDFSCPDFRPS